MTLLTQGKSWCFALLSGLVFFLGSAALAHAEDDLTIHSALLRPCEKNLKYDCVKVDVLLHVDAPLETVWQVITDYQHAAQFISNLRSSAETPLSPNTLKVEQVGRVGWGVLNVDIQTVYNVSLNPIEKKIQSVSVGGDLKTVSMFTQLKPLANGATLLEYSVVTDPGPWAPLAATEALLKQQARQSFTDLKREILRRANANLK